MSQASHPTKPKLSKFKVEQEEKRVHQLIRSVARSPEGRLAFRNVTGITFSDDVDRKQLPIVRMLVPTYGSPKPQVNNAVERMFAASQGVCMVAAEPAVSSSVVHWVRNELASRLYKSKHPFDYVLYMDDDIVPPPDALIKLLAAKKDIIAGACTVRQDPPLPNFRTYDPVKMTYTTAFQWSGEGVINVGAVGTGFMLISRKALEAVADYYMDCRFEKKYLGMSDEVAARLVRARHHRVEETLNAWWFEFLKHPLGDGEYGEDISFCFKARECGFEVHVDTSVRCGHLGQYAYGLDDYLHYQKDVVQDQIPVGQRVTDEVAALMEEVSEPCPA